MKPDRVIIVHLRQPRRNDPQETRADPFYELGSFGCTKCHSMNLMHPRRAHELDGARFAFAQGGPLGFRLILLTPPARIVVHRDRCEAHREDGAAALSLRGRRCLWTGPAIRTSPPCS